MTCLQFHTLLLLILDQSLGEGFIKSSTRIGIDLNEKKLGNSETKYML